MNLSYKTPRTLPVPGNILTGSNIMLEFRYSIGNSADIVGRIE
jgi:hypothetical protein